MAFPGQRKDTLKLVRAEGDGHLRALVDALRRNCWESFSSLFSEPIATLRRLNELAVSVVPLLLQLPEAPRLLSRLVEDVTDTALVVTTEERASMEKETRELRELLRVKCDFLRLTIHELRRPIGVATGYLSMVVDETFGEVPEALCAPLEQIRAAVGHMGSLVEGLAAVARIEDCADALRQAPCRLAAVVAAAVETVLAEAPGKPIRIEQHISQPELEVIADSRLLCIALVNLLGNAVKYAPAGSPVSLRAYTRMGAVAIEVSDQGPGIEPVEADRVFERYQRGTEAAGTSGLGLGLYIVHRIVELHGGLVSLDSVPGSGSTFTILLPAGPLPTVQSAPTPLDPGDARMAGQKPAPS